MPWPMADLCNKAVRVNPAFVRANEVKRLQGSRARLEATIGPVQDIALHETVRWMLEGKP